MKRSDIQIAKPCNQDWDTMTAEGRRRFCSACKKHVQDLSKMSAAEAREVLAAPPSEGLCVRYLYDEFGNVMFDMVDTSIVPASRLVRAAKVVASTAVAAGFAATISGCMGAPMRPPPPPPHVMMGEPAVMPEPSAQPIATSSSAPATSAPPQAPAPIATSTSNKP